MRKQALEGNVETLILAALREGPSYGYALVRDLNEKAEGLFRLGEGTVYPVLHRLERQGLIGAKWRTGEQGRERKYYHITVKGHKALARNAAEWKELTRVMEKALGENKVALKSGSAGWAMK